MLKLGISNLSTNFIKQGLEMVIIKTNLGDIVIELNTEKAPVTCENFLNYVKKGFYNDTIFHRVIPGFMIQGGGMTADMEQKDTDAPIKNEADNGLANDKFTIAMARTNDPHSATSQFFINTVDNDFLNYNMKEQNWGYCVFGKVVKGEDVVLKIQSVKTDNNKWFPHRDVPVETVIIQSAEEIDSIPE